MENFLSEFIGLVKKNYSNKDFIPLHEPVFNGNEKKYLNNAIDSTFVSSVGEYVNSVEFEIEKIANCKKAILTVNGTAALQVALLLSGVKTGDEVLTQSFSFVATANAISYLNAYPVFIDIDSSNFGLSSISLELFLKKNAVKRYNGTFNKKTGRKISACLPMHTFGFMCDIEKIISICLDWNIKVVEDAAEAFGSSFNKIKAGNFGLASAFSFNGNKVITAGGGGAIITNDLELAINAKHITTTARLAHPWKYFHDKIGYNFRMPNINAALLMAQIESFDSILKSKKEKYQLYENFFKNSPVTLVRPQSNTTWNHWLFTLKFNSENERNLWLNNLNKNGINARPPWTLIHEFPMYKDCFRDDQKNSNLNSKLLLNFPSGVS